MRRFVFPFLLAGILLSCLWMFLSLPAPSAYGMPSEALSDLARANVGHIDRGTDGPAPLRDGSYPPTPAGEVFETDKLPVNAHLLTKLVLVVAPSFGASVYWLLSTNARREGAICSSGVVRSSLTTAREEPSFLAVFLL